MITAPANSVLRAVEEDASVGLLLLQGLPGSTNRNNDRNSYS